VEAQVQLGEPGHRLHGRLVEAQLAQPLGDELRADHLVVVEAHAATLLVPLGAGLADVVQQRGEAQHEVRPGHDAVGARLERDRVVEHRERVLVDVLVAVVLVDLEAEGRQLGQHVLGEPGLHQDLQPEPRLAREQQLAQLVAHPLRGHDRDPLGHAHRGRVRRGVEREAQLRREPCAAHHAQRVVVERLAGVDGRAEHSSGQVGQPVERVDEGQLRQAHGHRVDGEVASRQVAVERVPEHDLGLAGRRVVGVGAVRRHLDDDVLARRASRAEPARADGAELAADVPVRVAPAGEDRLGLVGGRRRREVEVGAEPTEEGVTHRPTDERELVARLREQLAQLERVGRQRGEDADRALLQRDQRRGVRGLVGHSPESRRRIDVPVLGA